MNASKLRRNKKLNFEFFNSQLSTLPIFDFQEAKFNIFVALAEGAGERLAARLRGCRGR